MIRLDKISFAYGEKNILKDFCLTIPENGRICIFGESGCGKTTLLRILLGLETPQGGSIYGLDSLLPSVVFQENRLLPFKTVIQNITLVGADKQTALFHLNALGIVESADKYPSELSGGMQRRVAIARALSASYDYLVLDEPFSGLDRNNTELSAKHISECLSDRPLIMVSHSKTEAQLLFTEIVHL